MLAINPCRLSASCLLCIPLALAGCASPPVVGPVPEGLVAVAARSWHTSPGQSTLPEPQAQEVGVPEEAELYPGRIFLGARGNLNLGDGEPANDIPGFGAFGRVRVRGPWLIGGAVDSASWDFEEPANLLGISAADVVDAKIDSITASVWGEYELRLPDERWRRVRPFAGAGAGVAFLSDEQISGPIQGGGTFNLDVKGGTEIVPGLVGGVRLDIIQNLVFEAGVRIDYHFTDMEVTDLDSGSTASVDDYHTYGAYIGLLLRL